MTTKDKKILIVEDEISLLRPLSDSLRQEEFVVIEAQNGEEGLKKALSEKPDLILLDIAMPKMNGLEMLAEVRKDSWGKDVKVIILTNLDGMEKIAEAAKQQTFDYLVKSDWETKDIIKKVKDKLELS